MGERDDELAQAWPREEPFWGVIDLHVLPPTSSIDGARIRELTGDDSIPDSPAVLLNAFCAVAGDRTFYVGFCLGDGDQFSAVGIAVIERLTLEAPDAPLHVVPVKHEDIAWDLVLSNLRTFSGRMLLFAFPNSDVYDAGTAETHYSKYIRRFDDKGKEQGKLTEAQRREIRARKAEILNRPPPPKFYSAGNMHHEDAEWIFRVVTPAGKVIRTAVWDGRRDYAHELPEDIVRWVGGDKIALVQVASPVGVDRRSSLDLTHRLAKDYDGVVHWAKDTETFQSILRSFVRLDLEAVGRPNLADDWKPEIMIFAANE